MFGFVLCADDYAMTAGISRGILDLLALGRLSATGAMTNRPHWPEWASSLLDFDGRADLGVHLNLTCGRPLRAMPTFAPGGALPKLPAVLKLAMLGRLPAAEIARRTALSEPNVRRYLRQLVADRLVEQLGGRGRSETTYRQRGSEN